MTTANTTYINYLIELSKAGRARSFLDLCEINLRNVYTLTFRLLNEKKAAEKVALQTFIYAWDDIKNFESGKPFVPWIKKIAVGLALDEMQNQSDNSTPKNVTVSESFIENEIKKLPIESRAIFVLHDLEGYSYKEIQEIFPGMIEDEIKTILIYSRQYLISKMNL